MPARNDPALTHTTPACALPHDNPDAARLAAEIKHLDAAVARMTSALGYYEEPSQYAAALRRLA